MTTVEIPDGGWGWVIVACSFLVHMLIVGTMYALSVLYVAWLQYFQSGHGLTSWIISLAVSFTFAIGPLPGSLSKRVGNRAVVIAGGLVTALGFFASVFAPNVYFLMVSIGLVTGTGAGFCFLPSVSLVAMYFTTKRSLAMGIAASGLGVGAFFMAPFLNWLVDFYGWRGCLLICSGISLNMCVLGTLMLPVERAPKLSWGSKRRTPSLIGSSTREVAVETYNIEKLRLTEDEDNLGGGEGKFRRHDEYHQLGKVSPSPEFLESPPRIEITASGDESADKDSEVIRKYLNNGLDQNSCLNQSDSTTPKTNYHVCCISHNHFNHDQILTSENSSLFPNVPLLEKSSEKCHHPNISNSACDCSKHSHQYLDSKKNVPDNSCTKSLVNNRVRSLQTLSNIRTDDKPFASNSELSSVPYFQPSISKVNDLKAMLAGSMSSFLYVSKHSLVSTPSHQGDTTDATTGSSSDVGSSFSVYVRLLCHAQFMWFCVSNFITNLSYFMPVLYMVDRAVDYGISKADAAMLISIYGAGNILGKLALGFLADRGYVDRLVIYIACLIVCGVATGLSPLCGTHHWLHALYAFVFGFFIGGYATLFGLVTVDLLGLADVGEAFGLLLAFMGVGIVLGTPVAGWVFDWTGSYTASFILHGGFIVLSAAMNVPLLVKKMRRSSRHCPVGDLE